MLELVRKPQVVVGEALPSVAVDAVKAYLAGELDSDDLKDCLKPLRRLAKIANL